MPRRILIVGASIAGNTAAWWLGRLGHEITVVERAPVFRDGGQSIDMRGVGREVLRCMGLERGTGEEGATWFDRGGKVVVAFLTDALSGDGPTAAMEILRGHLACVIYEPAREQATFRFGDRIERIGDGEDRLKWFAAGLPCGALKLTVVGLIATIRQPDACSVRG